MIQRRQAAKDFTEEYIHLDTFIQIGTPEAAHQDIYATLDVSPLKKREKTYVTTRL